MDVDRRDIARALGTNPRTVARWLNTKTAPRPEARERLLELIVLLERLPATLKPAPARARLFSSHRSLNYHKPVDLLREGEFRRVLGAIDALPERVFA